MSHDIKLFIFDLDGTLTESKQPISPEMRKILLRLLHDKKVAVISGARFTRFQKQLLQPLRAPKNLLSNLALFPTSGAVAFCYRAGWQKIYEHAISAKRRALVRRIFQKVLTELKYHPVRRYGPLLEDRKTQITFSALGQHAPLSAKRNWSKKGDVRPRIVKELKKHLPDFEIRTGGLTSIDVTEKGINKAYGVKKILSTFRVTPHEAIFFGDALGRGGNDVPARRDGERVMKVSGPKDIEKIIEPLIADAQ